MIAIIYQSRLRPDTENINTLSCLVDLQTSLLKIVYFQNCPIYAHFLNKY